LFQFVQAAKFSSIQNPSNIKTIQTIQTRNTLMIKILILMQKKDSNVFHVTVFLTHLFTIPQTGNQIKQMYFC